MKNSVGGLPFNSCSHKAVMELFPRRGKKKMIVFSEGASVFIFLFILFIILFHF